MTWSNTHAAITLGVPRKRLHIQQHCIIFESESESEIVRFEAHKQRKSFIENMIVRRPKTIVLSITPG